MLSARVSPLSVKKVRLPLPHSGLAPLFGLLRLNEFLVSPPATSHVYLCAVAQQLDGEDGKSLVSNATGLRSHASSLVESLQK